MHWRGLVDSLVLGLVIYLCCAGAARRARSGSRSRSSASESVRSSRATVWVLDGATLAAVIVILIVFRRSQTPVRRR